jgi:hypothetical protein
MATKNIGTRIGAEDLAEVDRLIGLTGQTRSAWLIGVIRAELGRSDAVTVRSMAARLDDVETRLDSLRRAIA